jgi:aminomethyltransferase
MNCPSSETLQQTPLYSQHLALKAKMVPFAGWLMPLQYEGIIAEYAATRQKAGFFDTSHMGEFLIEGDHHRSGLDRIVTCRIADMPLNTCRYGMMLNDRGGIIDDLTVYRLDQAKWFIVVNAAGIPAKAEHFGKNLASDAVFRDISDATGKVDLQGPLSREVLKELAPGIERLEYFTSGYFELLKENTLISRTGYTGELGYEIYFPAEKIKDLWQEILKNDKVKPAGLGVRDLLRLEMGYSLYGQDLAETINPLEAGLGRFVDFEKDFIGRDALLIEREKGPVRKMVGLISESRRSPRCHYKIYSTDSRPIGEVTSGIFSPALEKGIGMGYVAKEYSENGINIFFGDEKITTPGQIIKRPFYKKGSLKT